MAERRMFAKCVVQSAQFLKMPIAARLLYYDLGMAADDDGVVEAFTVIRTTGASKDDLMILASKKFVQVVNDDLVTVILDWKRNNQIRKDRYRPSIYRDLLSSLGAVVEESVVTEENEEREKTEKCPFCGGDAYLHFAKSRYLFVKCDVCGATGKSYYQNLTTEEMDTGEWVKTTAAVSAVRAWNRRN